MKRFILVLLLLILISGFVSAEESMCLGAVAEDYAIKALEWLESGAGWVADQVPLYVEELLNWYLAKNIILMLLYTLLMTMPIILIRWGIIALKDCSSWQSDAYAEIWGLLFGALSLFFIAGVVFHLLEVIKIAIAPRVWLLEYLTELVN